MHEVEFRKQVRRALRPRLDVQTKVDDSTLAPPQSARSTTGAAILPDGPPSPFRRSERPATRRCAASCGAALYPVMDARPQFSAMTIPNALARQPSRCVRAKRPHILIRDAR